VSRRLQVALGFAVVTGTLFLGVSVVALARGWAATLQARETKTFWEGLVELGKSYLENVPQALSDLLAKLGLAALFA